MNLKQVKVDICLVQGFSALDNEASRQHRSSMLRHRPLEPRLASLSRGYIGVQPPEEVYGPESKLDEMWSYVGKKDNHRWLWHAIDHDSGKVIAYVFGRRKDKVFLQLKLLEPNGINRFYTDGWGAYSRYLEPQKHEVGKHNMHKIESKHINIRTRIKRLARKTICFSKTIQMHDIVIGLFINRYEFGVAI